MTEHRSARCGQYGGEQMRSRAQGAMAHGEHAAAHRVEGPDAQPVLDRTSAYAELRELAAR